MTKHVDCPCWQAGEFIWTNRCPVHFVRHPLHFSHRELEKMAEIVKNAEPTDACWQIIDGVRVSRDGP